MSACLDAEQLELLAIGALGEQASGELSSHLEQCSTCSERFDQIVENNQVAGDLRQLLRAEVPRIPPQPQEAKPSARKIGGYEVVRELARTVCSVVLEARQSGTGQRVALKVLPEWAASDPRRRRRFEREIELQAELRHPSIVPVYDSGLASGQYFLVTPLIEGEEADAFVDRAQPSMRERVELVRGICVAIAHAHQRGILHRDIKPSNVLVDAEARPFVLDFGLGKLLRDSDDGELSALTIESGAVLGTPAYMSPEQAAGRSSEVDVRSDVYSLGALAYRLFCGQTPHSSRLGLAQLLEEVQHVDPAPPSLHDKRIARDLDRIIAKAMAKDPAARYQSVNELAEDLGRYLDGRIILARQPSIGYVLRRAAHKHAAKLGVLAAILVMIVAAGVMIVVRAQRQAEALVHFQDANWLYEQRNSIPVHEWMSRLPAALDSADQALELAPELALAYLVRARLRTQRLDQMGPVARLDELDLALRDFQQVHDKLAPRGLPQALWEGVQALNEHVFQGPLSNGRADIADTQTSQLTATQRIHAYDTKRVEWIETLAARDPMRYGDLATLSRYAFSENRLVPSELNGIERWQPVLALQTQARIQTAGDLPGPDKHMHFGDLDSAREAIQRALEQDRNNANSWRMSAEIAIWSERADDAIECIKEAIALRGETFTNLNLLGDAYALANRFEESAKTLQALVEKYPNEPGAHNYLARAFIRLGEYDRAAREARTAIDLNPLLQMAWSNLHLSLWKRGRWEEADELYEQLESDGQETNYGVWMNQAESLYARGRTDESRRLLGELRENTRTPSELLLWNHALTLKACGRLEHARREMDLARTTSNHRNTGVRAQVVLEYLLSEEPTLRDEALGLELAEAMRECTRREPLTEIIQALAEVLRRDPRAALSRLESVVPHGDDRAWHGLVEALTCHELELDERSDQAFTSVANLVRGQPQDPRLAVLFHQTAERLGRFETVRAVPFVPLFESRY